MPVFINGKPLSELFEQNDIKLSEIENVIDMKISTNLESVFEKDFKNTLTNIGIEYTHHESIDDWIRDLLKY